MSGEWKYGTFTWSPTGGGGSQDSQDLMDDIESFLTQSGWTKVVGYGDAGDRYYLRTDKATEETWLYTGDGSQQHCGLNVWNEQYNGGGMDGTARIHVRAWLENIAGDAVQKTAHTNATIYVDFNETADNSFLLIGGEDGLYVEGYTAGQTTRDVAVGMVATFLPWAAMNGSRDVERSYASQGLGMDWRGATRFSEQSDRSLRVVLNDGFESNKTAALKPYVCRRASMFSASVADDQRCFVGALDTLFGFTPSSLPTSTYREMGFSFGLLSASLDDRWRLSPIIMQQEELWTNAAVDTTSSSNTVSASSGTSWHDIRLMRILSRLVVASNLLSPWQLITDDVSGNQYRLADMDDDGRNVYLGIEWPGAANEVTI